MNPEDKYILKLFAGIGIAAVVFAGVAWLVVGFLTR